MDLRCTSSVFKLYEIICSKITWSLVIKQLRLVNVMGKPPLFTPPYLDWSAVLGRQVWKSSLYFFQIRGRKVSTHFPCVCISSKCFFYLTYTYCSVHILRQINTLPLDCILQWKAWNKSEKQHHLYSKNERFLKVDEGGSCCCKLLHVLPGYKWIHLSLFLSVIMCEGSCSQAVW